MRLYCRIRYLFLLEYIFEIGQLNEDYEDDGEGGAGSKLLFLLQRKNLSNILIVVSRWYGGVNLGSDRFKCMHSLIYMVTN